MALPGIEQPDFLWIEDWLRLRKYNGDYQVAIKWYQDPVVYYNSEGITNQEKIPDENYVKGMYKYLSEAGECYFIEVIENGSFVPIGDITLKEENLPIVIGEGRYRGIGLGKKVMGAILRRAREVGIPKIRGSIVYTYNVASQKLHESLGFRIVEIRENEIEYELLL